jgi:hypothetical protein
MAENEPPAQGAWIFNASQPFWKALESLTPEQRDAADKAVHSLSDRPVSPQLENPSNREAFHSI